MLAYEYQKIHKHLKNLVKSIDLENAAVAINTYFPCTSSVTTLSRKINETTPWSVRDLIALQADSMNFQSNKQLLQIQQRIEEETAGGRRRKNTISPAEMNARFSVEAGEAIAALIRARESRDCGDLAEAVLEFDDVIAVATALRAGLLAELSEGKGKAA